MFKVVPIALLLIASFIHTVVQSQVLVPAIGKVEKFQDDKISQLSEQYKKMSLKNPEIDGYRVQLFFESGSNSKNKATNLKSDFDAVHPDVKSYLSYKEPYYRVRVGNFHTLAEAVGFQKKLASEYPNAFAVKDKIEQ